MKTPGNPSFAKVCLLALMLVSYTDTFVLASPRGGHVVSGTASFTQEGNLTVITAGNRSVINYQSFNIAPGEIVRFVQPNGNSSVLNRVTSPNPTNIFGQLQANGNVYIVNPYGVFFQNGSVLNVGSLYAGSGKISDADFAAGRIHFTDLAGDVRNDGVLAADNRIVLMGANVVNNGTMTAAHGLATMVSGREVYVGERNSNVFVRANGTAGKVATASAVSSGSVTNTGTVAAPRVLLGAGDLYSTAIVNSGVLRGHDITVNAGRNGTATVGGQLDASAKGKDPTALGVGGNIQVLGGSVALQGAALDASGANGGGSVRVGGDFHGGGTLARSGTTTVDAATTINADATGAQGDGGSVVLWSDQATSFAGSISARGGSLGGNGGSVEVSSEHNLLYQGATDLRAPAGAIGSLLLDPDNIIIDTVGLTTLTPTPPTTTVAFGDAPTTATFTPALLITALGTSAVILQANNNITFNSNVDASATTNPLTLQAGNSISLATNVAVSLGGLFTATINDHSATAANRAAGDATFTMNTGSSLTANGGVTISSDNGVAATPTGVGAISLTKVTTVGTSIQVTNTATNSVVVPANETITMSGTPPTSGTLVTTPTAADTAGGSVTLTSAGAMTTIGITTTGTGMGAGGAVLLTAPTLSLKGTVAGLSLTTGTGTVATFNTGGTATTTGLQKYQGPVVVNVPTLTLTGGAAISFTDTVNGTAAATNSLVVNTPGDENFGGVVGGTVPLVNLTTDSLAPVGGSARFNMTLPTGATVLGGVNLSGALQVGDAVIFNTASPSATHPTINTTGAQTYTGGASLVSNAYLLSGSTLALNSTVTSGTAKALTLDTVGAITLGGPVGAGMNLGLGSLTTVGGAAVGLNGGSVTTTAIAGQTYSGTVSLGAPTVLTATGSGTVNFNSTITGAQTLEVTAAGLTTFGGTVGTSVIPLTSLNVDGAGGAAFAGPVGGAKVFTNGAAGQNYSGTVSLSVPTVLSATGTGTVTFGSTITGAQTLEVTAAGLTTFSGTVGTTVTPLTSLTVDGAGGTKFTGGTGATTNGAQAYTGLLTLATPVTLTIQGAGFNFSAGSLDGTTGVLNGLTVNTSNTGTATLGGATHTLTVVSNAGDLVFNVGTLTLNGLVGPGDGTAGATSLTANTAVQTSLFGTSATGPTVATSGVQNYGKVVLSAASSLLSTASDINAATIDTGANNLTLTATAGNIQLGAAANTGVVLSGTGTDVFSTRTLTLNGKVGADTATPGAASLTAVTSVQTNLNGANVTTSGSQAYNSAVLGADTTLTATSATMGQGQSIGFTGTVNSTAGTPYTLTLTTTATDASVTLGGQVGGAAGATPATSVALKDLTVNSPTTFINGGGVTTIPGSTLDGKQTYSGTVSLGLDTTLSGSTFSAAGVTGNNRSLILSFSNPLTVSNVLFTGINNFTVTGGGATTITTDISTLGFQDYENAVTLKTTPVVTGLTLTSTNNAAITFGSTLNSTANEGLTLVTTGAQTFKGAVGTAGPTTALGFLTTGTGGAVGINGGAVTTSTATGQNYHGPVSLGAAGGPGATTTLTAGGNGSVTFDSGITGSTPGQELDIVSTNTVTFGGLVGTAGTPLFGLKVGGVGMTSPAIDINGSAATGTGVTTSGATGQIYGGNVLLGTTATPRSTTLTAGAGPITFNGTVDGVAMTAQALTLSTTTGLITLGGVVGGTTKLDSLTTTGGPVDINGNGTAVATSGAAGQSYGGPVLLGGTGVVSQTLSAVTGPITFVSTLDGAHNLEIVTPGLTTFGNTVGTLAPLTSLTSLTVDNNASITGGGVVTTVTNQSYGGLGLGLNTVLNGASIAVGLLTGNTHNLTVNGSSSTFGQIITGGVLVFNDGSGTASFTGTIAGTSLQVTGPGLTEFSNAPAGTPETVTTAGSQAYGGPVQLDVNTTLTDTASGAITFSRTVDGSGVVGTTQTLAVVTNGTTTFNAPVGGTNALGSLTVGSAVVNSGTTVFGTTGVPTTNAVTTVNNGAANGGGVQTYFNDVQLNVGTTTLQSNMGTTAAGGDINFKSTVESFDAMQRSLVVNTQGNEIFGGLVGGGGRPLLGLVTDGPGVDSIDGQTQFNFTLPAIPGVAGIRLGANGLTVNDQAVFNVAGSSSNKVDPLLVTGATDNPTVFSDGPQVYNSFSSTNGIVPILLQAPTVLKGTTLIRAGGITGTTANSDLTLDFSGGTVTIDSGITGLRNFASVGTGVASGTVINDSVPFVTSGYQYYRNPTTLSQDTVLTSTGPGATGNTIFFDGLLDGPHNLTVNTAGDEIFKNLVGSSAPLLSLTTDALGAGTGTAIFRMSITPGTAGVHVVGPGGVTVNDLVAFGATGATLTTPTVLSDGGPQTYQKAATLLNADAILTNTAVADITFGSSINGTAAGTYNLTLNSPGNEVFHGQVGNAFPLLSLTTDAIPGAGNRGGAAIFALTIPPGTVPQSVITINNVAPSGTATGAQTYNDAVTISQATVLSSTYLVGTALTGGAITFNGTVDSTTATPENLTVLAGAGQTVFGPGATTLNAASVTLGGAQVTFNGPVGATHGLGNLIIGRNDSGMSGIVSSIDINNGGLVTTLGQAYSDALLLSANTVLTAGGNASITFASTVDSVAGLGAPFALTLNTGGVVTFNGKVGGANMLASLTSTAGSTVFNMDASTPSVNPAGVNVVGDPVLGAVTIGGTVTFNEANSSLAHPSVATTSGAQTYTGAASLTANTVLAAGGSANIAFGSTVDSTPGGLFTLTLITNGVGSFAGKVGGAGALLSLATDAGGTTVFNMDAGTPSVNPAGVNVVGAVTIGDLVTFNEANSSLAHPSVATTSGAQTYAGAASLTANTVLAAGGSANIAFGSTVDSTPGGLFTLTLITNGVGSFAGKVGGTGALLSLATDAGGTTVFNMDAGTPSVNPAGVNVSGAVTIGDLVTFNEANSSLAHPSVATTSGAQTYTGAASLTANTVLTAGNNANIGFIGTVNGTFALTLSTGGQMIFNNTVGAGTALLSLTTTGAGETDILGGGQVVTTTFQSYGGTAGTRIGLPTTLTAGSNITFVTTLDGVSTAVNSSLVLTAPGQIEFDQPVGGAVRLTQLTATGGTLLFKGGPVTTLLGQTYSGPAVLGTSTILNSQGGDILFNSTVDSVAGAGGPFALTLNTGAGGVMTFKGKVGGTTALASLTTTGGTTVFNMDAGTASVNPAGVNVVGAVTIGDLVTFNEANSSLAHPSVATTSGAQTYAGAASLTANTVLAAGGSANIAFGSTVDSTPGGLFTLTLITNGVGSFAGKVGGTGALLSLATDAGGTTVFNMDAGTPSVNPAGVNVSGAVTIGDLVTFNEANSSLAHPSVATTSGAQTYAGAASLTANTVLAAGNNANILFNSTVNGGSALTLNTGGATIFNGFVGGTMPLLNLTTDAGGSTQINGGGVTTSSTDGTQTYNDAVVLGTDTSLSSRVSGSGVASGNIVFNSTVNGAFVLKLDTGGLAIFNDLVGNGVALSALAVDSEANPGAGTQFNMTVGTAQAGVLVNGAVAVYSSVTFNVKGSSLTQPGVLTLANGQQTYNGAITLATNTVIVSAAGLPAVQGAFTEGGEILFGSTQGIASTVGNEFDLIVRAGVGSTTFASTIDVNRLDLGGAQATFNGPISRVGLLSIEPNGGVAGGIIVLNGGGLTTAGAQIYNTAVILGADTILTSLNTGNNGADIVFTSTVDSDGSAPRALTLNTPGDEVFNGLVGNTNPLASLTTDATGVVSGSARFNMSLDGLDDSVAGVRTTGVVTINDKAVFNVTGSSLAGGIHPGVASGGTQTYASAVTLSQDTQLFSTGVSAINFLSTVDGSSGLSLTAAGGQAFNDFVGSVTPLTSLTASGGTTSFNMSLTGSPTVAAGVQLTGDLTINGAVLFNVVGSTVAHPSVLTAGTSTQTYNGAATLGQNTVLTGGGGLVFNSTVDGGRALKLNTGGDTFFGALVGSGTPLTSLVTDAGGTTTFKGGGVATTGLQTYNDAVVLQSNTLLTSANTAGDGGTITFTTTVDGASTLATATTGDTFFGGLVGNSVPLTNLTVAGTATFQGGGVATTGLQSYGGAVTLLADTALASTNEAGDGSITFAQTVDGRFRLSINTTNDTRFNGFVGGSDPLLSIAVDTVATTGTLTFQGGGAATIGGQTYGGPVTLAAATSLTSANTAGDGGNITFNQTIDGGQRLSVVTSGNMAFFGLVGTTTPLTSLTTGTVAVPGTTLLQGGGVATTGPQTYHGAVTLGANAILTSSDAVGDGLIVFNQTVNGPGALQVNTPNNTFFYGFVGNVTPLLSLSTGVTGVAGAVIFNGGGATTTGLQNYGGAVTLANATVLKSTNDGGDGSITFAQTVDGPGTLQTDTTNNTRFNGFVGGIVALGNLTTTGTVTFQGGGATTTGIQSYGGAVTLASDTGLTSTNAVGGGDITFGQTVDGGYALNISSASNTTFNGLVGDRTPLASLTTGAADGVAPGNVIFATPGGTNAVTTEGVQSFGGAVTLADGDNIFTVNGPTAGVTFGQTVDGTSQNASNLVISATALSILAGDVGTNLALATVSVDGPLSITGGTVLTSGNQVYKGNLYLARTDGGTTNLNARLGDLRFGGDISSGALLAQGHRILVQGNIRATGNLDLEAHEAFQTSTGRENPDPLLLLTGSTYTSTGNISLNARAGSDESAKGANATIVLTNNSTTFKGASFTVAQYQKIFSLGSVSIETSGITMVGDIAAHDTLKINASEVDLIARPAGTSGNGLSNSGLNFVAEKGIDFGSSRVTFTGDSNRTASFITTGGNVNIKRIEGISLFKDPNLDSQFRQDGQFLRASDFNANNFFNVNNPLQPVGGGSQALDTAAALSGALPDQKPVDVSSDITITASQMEELKKLGIHPRLAQKTERRATGSKRALFAQLVDGQDPENYGLLQPIKGGISRLEPSDYVVVVDRMGEREVSSILESFEGLYGKNKEKAPEIGAAFQTAFNDYTVQKQTADPAGFTPFLESQHGKYPAVDKATRSFDDLFGHIEHLGLTDKEVFKSEEHIVSDLGVSGVSPADMVKVINSLRKKLPADQRASSTKAPASAPASNPAPNATAPAAPAQPVKKAAPLKTARQQKQGTPEKTARRAPAMQPDLDHDVAGL